MANLRLEKVINEYDQSIETVNLTVYCRFKSGSHLFVLQKNFWVFKIKYAHELLVRHHFIFGENRVIVSRALKKSAPEVEVWFQFV